MIRATEYAKRTLPLRQRGNELERDRENLAKEYGAFFDLVVEDRFHGGRIARIEDTGTLCITSAAGGSVLDRQEALRFAGWILLMFGETGGEP